MKIISALILACWLYTPHAISMHANKMWEESNRRYEQNRQQTVQYQLQQQAWAQQHMAEQSRLTEATMRKYHEEQNARAEEAAIAERILNDRNQATPSPSISLTEQEAQAVLFKNARKGHVFFFGKKK